MLLARLAVQQVSMAVDYPASHLMMENTAGGSTAGSERQKSGPVYVAADYGETFDEPLIWEPQFETLAQSALDIAASKL